MLWHDFLYSLRVPIFSLKQQRQVLVLTKTG